MVRDAMSILKKYNTESHLLKDSHLPQFLMYSKPDITYFLLYSLFEKDPLAQKKD